MKKKERVFYCSLERGDLLPLLLMLPTIIIMFIVMAFPLLYGLDVYKRQIAHIDSPRLDLKPNPLYEDADLALLKTHYYGGIRKYQWGVTPLALHGVVAKKDGEIVELHVGEEAGDPVFCVTDLLPHLGAEQSKRPLGEGLKGEELNILVGSLPYADEEVKNRVKMCIRDSSCSIQG